MIYFLYYKQEHNDIYEIIYKKIQHFSFEECIKISIKVNILLPFIRCCRIIAR